MIPNHNNAMASLGVGFIGLGNMGAAIARGLQQAGVQRVFAVEPRDDAFAGLAVERVTGVTELAARCQVVVVAVKPWLVRQELQALSACTPRPAVVISIAAGVPLAELAAAFGTSDGVFRAMPNLAATVGAAMTAIYADDRDAGRWAIARKVLGSTGRTVDLAREDDMHGFTAVAGSGPAYIAALVEALADAGVAEGLPRAVANHAAIEMVRGTGELLASGAWTPAGLKEAVMSPGGTTAAGIVALESQGARGALMAAVRAAAARSREMARGDR